MDKILNAVPSLANPKLVLPKNAGKLAGPEGLGLWAKWELELRDGEKILDKREGAAHSFVKNWGKLIRGMFDVTDNTNETLTDSSGVTFSPRIKSGSGIASDGAPIIFSVGSMKFGNSNAALSAAQTELQGSILSAATAAIVFTAITEDSTKTQFKCEGSVLNTGGSFTVEEIGLYVNLRRASVNSNAQTLMLRDLTGSVVVAGGLTILGRYTFTLAV